jgi:hypothetical protein
VYAARASIAVLGLGLALGAGCKAPVSAIVPPDDDDDDDNSWLLDDDDTPPEGDPPLRMNFTAAFSVTCPAEPEDSNGDDDDSTSSDDDDSGASDDDDSGGPEPLPPCDLDVRMTVSYWIDAVSGELGCEQILVASGLIWLGAGAAPDFPESTAFYEIDRSTWADASEPTNPDHCDPVDLWAAGYDYGTKFIIPAQAGGFGDFNQGAILSAGVHAALGIDFGVQRDYTAAFLTAQLSPLGLTYAGMRFQDARLGGIGSRLGNITVPLGDYFPDMILSLDTALNPEADPTSTSGFVGAHAGGAVYYMSGPL